MTKQPQMGGTTAAASVSSSSSAAAFSAYPAGAQWLAIVLASAANFVNQADRIVMAIAVVPMSAELGLSTHDKGWLLASFNYGYVLTQVCAGPLAKKHGAARTLAAALFGWCTLTVLTPTAASYGITFLTLMRVFMGFCEGFCWPASYTWLTDTVDASRRGRAFTLLIAGGSAGQLVALLVCPKLAWATMFVAFGMTGYAWLLAYFLCSPSSRRASDPEVRLRDSGVVYLRMVQHPAVLAILAAHFTHAWGLHVLNTWLPTYLNTVHGVGKERLWIAAFPLAVTTVVSPLYGVWADRLAHRGVSLLTIRRVLSGVGFVGPAACFAVLPYAETEFGAVAVVSGIFVTGGCLGSGVFSNHADILPGHAGMAFGLGNTLATLPGLVVGPLTAHLIETEGVHGWTSVFHAAAFFNIVGAFVYTRYCEVLPLEGFSGAVQKGEE